MADGFLERSFDLYQNKKKITRISSQNLTSLLKKNRSYRGYDKKYKVTETVLEKIVEVNQYIPSAKNQQVLRFKLITKCEESDIVVRNIKLGGMLPELHLPYKDTEPEAFIIVCSNKPESKLLYIDLGISAQSMLLRAVELGYNGVIIGAFNAKKLQSELGLSITPLLVIAIGKGNENIQLTEIHNGDDVSYYRRDGIHYVPKINWKDLLI